MWNREIETLPRERMNALQLERLRATVGRVLAGVEPLADRFRAAGLGAPEDLRSTADLRRLPFTCKADLREHYPFGLFAVPISRLARIQGSSGTKGKLTIVGYTRNDLAIWAEVVARCLALGGVRPGMVVHNAYGYGLFTGGLGLQGGADLLGCTVVPISGGMTQRQATLLRDLGGQVLCSTPSYALSIAEALDAGQIPRSALKLEIGIFGAEPWTDQLRDELERRLGLTALNIYGLAEIIGPGVSAECIEGRNGSHVQEDHFLAEVIDPESGEPLPAGQEGELVFTTLTKEALPLIRYRTGDISSLETAPCVCGRTTVRMSRVRGRHDDMLIIRGVNLYPSEVERILLEVGDLGPHYQLIVERPGSLDELSLLCEPVRDGLDPDQLQSRLHHALREQIGLSITVRILEREAVPRSEGKAVRVVDRRPR
jgi:phenylacetate-CoA ligase